MGVVWGGMEGEWWFDSSSVITKKNRIVRIGNLISSSGGSIV